MRQGEILNKIRSVIILAGLLAIILLPQVFAITFQNVTISGDLSGGATYSTGANYIDFNLPNANVGDPFSKRIGEVVITFEALSDHGLFVNSDIVALLGALSGSGIIEFNEVIEDLDNPGVIAQTQATLNDNSMLPYHETLQFERAAAHIKVKKSFVLSAEATNHFDLASVAFVEQTFTQIPEPASTSLIALGGLMLLGRLRK